MKRAIWLLIGMLLLTTCTPATPTATPTPVPPSPTPTVDFAAPEAVGRQFLRDWEAQDFPAMYQLLAPSLRSGLPQEDFTQAYHTTLDIATVISLTLTPTALSLNGNHAWIDFTEQWHTGLFGELRTDNRLPLIQEAGQWWIDWSKETIWPALTQGRSFAVTYQIPRRANIYDHNGDGLAVPSTIVTVGVVPGQIEDEAAVLTALSEVLGLSTEEIKAKYSGQPADWFIPIADISGEESLAHDAQLTLQGIRRRESAGRLYPQGGVGSTAVGWVSLIPAEKLASYRQRGYRGDEWVGIAGLEGWGESILAGQHGGKLYIIGPDGDYIQGIAERRPQRGRAIYATLDRTFQAQVEQILGERKGAVVAMDIHNGAILALASGPHFDNNLFVHPSEAATLQQVLDDPRHPLFDRATQGTYPPGSLFKIVTMAAGLEAADLTPESPFYCPGYWDGLGEANRKYCWLRSGHGHLTLEDALAASCNVTFYEVGKRLDGIGQDILPTYARAFGLGHKTGLVSLPEADGLIPDPTWKEATYQQPWGTGDTVNMAIGQGYVLVTPLQIVRMIAAIANGGTLYRPYLVDRIAAGMTAPEQVTAPHAEGRLPLTPEHLAAIRQAMLAVTTRQPGTAVNRFAGLSIPVAGKTGTAEVPGEDVEPHAWFAGYFPADDPQIALVVMVENSGEGSAIAAPLFRQIVEAHYGLPLTPLPVETPTEGD